MGPTWVLSAPYGPHVGPMNLAIRDGPRLEKCCQFFFSLQKTRLLHWANKGALKTLNCLLDVVEMYLFEDDPEVKPCAPSTSQPVLLGIKIIEDIYIDTILNNGDDEFRVHNPDLRELNYVTQGVNKPTVKPERKPADVDIVIDIIDQNIDLKLNNNSLQRKSVSDIKSTLNQTDFDTAVDIVQNTSPKLDLKSPIISVQEKKENNDPSTKLKLKSVEVGIVLGKGPPVFLTELPKVQMSNAGPFNISYTETTPKWKHLNAGNSAPASPLSESLCPEPPNTLPASSKAWPAGEGIFSVSHGLMPLPTRVYSDWHMGCLVWVLTAATRAKILQTVTSHAQTTGNTILLSTLTSVANDLFNYALRLDNELSARPPRGRHGLWTGLKTQMGCLQIVWWNQ